MIGLLVVRLTGSLKLWVSELEFIVIRGGFVWVLVNFLEAEDRREIEVEASSLDRSEESSKRNEERLWEELKI